MRDKEIVQAIHLAQERLKLMIAPPSVMAWFSTKQEPQLVGNQIGVGLTKGTVEWLQPGHGLAGLRLSSDRVVNGPRAQGTAVALPVRPHEKVHPE